MASALRELLAKFTVDVDTSTLAAGVAKVDAFAKKITGFLDAIAGKDGFSKKFKELSDDLRDRASEIGAVSKVLGISSRDFQKIGFQTGLGIDQIGSGLKTLQQLMGAAGAGAGQASIGTGALGQSLGALVTPSGDAIIAFKKLGVEVNERGTKKAKPLLEVFSQLAVKIGKIKDPATRAALAVKFFGGEGINLLPYLSKTKEEIEALAKDFEDLGGGISDKTIKAYKGLEIQGRRLSLVQTSLYSAVAEQVVPILTKKVEVVVKLLSSLFKLQKGTNAVKATVILFGAAMLWLQRTAVVAGIKTALAWAPTVLAIAGLILLLDDLITYFEGGKSAFGDFIEAGKGSQWRFFKLAATDFDDLVAKMRKSPDTLSAIEEAFSTVGASIVRFFIDDIPEAASFAWKDIKASASEFWEWLGALPGRAWASIAHGWTQIGTNIATGIAGGLDAAWDAINAAVGRVAEKIKGTFASLFKANSPSKVMIDDTQVMIGGGIVGGLIKSIPMVGDAAESLYSHMMLPQAQPSLPVPSASGYGPVSQSVQNTNRIDITVQGGPSNRDTAESIRDGILPALNDNARATLAALEYTVDNG